MLVILMVALANFVVGSIMGPGTNEQEQARGFLGYNCKAFILNKIQFKRVAKFITVLHSGSYSRKLEPRLHGHRWTNAGFLLRFFRVFSGRNRYLSWS